jgi:hypothetical protein
MLCGLNTGNFIQCCEFDVVRVSENLNRQIIRHFLPINKAAGFVKNKPDFAMVSKIYFRNNISLHLTSRIE